MYDTYRYIFIGGLVLSIVFFAVTIFIFFFLNIRDAIGDITGSKKRKAVEKAKEGKQAKEKIKKPKPVNTTVNQAEKSSELTSRMSIQDRYNAMGNEETAILNHQPDSPPQPEPRQQSVNAYTPTVINDPDFVLETDITYVHSSEVIV